MDTLYVTLCLLLVAIASTTDAFEPFAIVSKGGDGNFTTVQDAIDAIPKANIEEKIILIKAGEYVEHVSINQSFVTLVGEDAACTKITYHLNHNMTGSSSESASVRVRGSDFRAFHLTFENTAPWPTPVGGQAPAINVRGQRNYFEDCVFTSWQDTVLFFNGTSYLTNCTVVGQVDFIWGRGRGVLDKCTLQSVSKGKSAYITADGNKDPAFQRGGILIRNSELQLQAGVKHYLGRTWGIHSHTIFADMELPAGIEKEGWLTMTQPPNTVTTRVGEFNTSGPGADQSGRVEWAHKFESVPSTAEFLLTKDTKWLEAPRYK